VTQVCLVRSKFARCFPSLPSVPHERVPKDVSPVCPRKMWKWNCSKLYILQLLQDKMHISRENCWFAVLHETGLDSFCVRLFRAHLGQSWVTYLGGIYVTSVAYSMSRVAGDRTFWSDIIYLFWSLGRKPIACMQFLMALGSSANRWMKTEKFRAHHTYAHV